MLDWHSATSADIPSLRSFRCTHPPFPAVDDETGEEFHEYPWEFEVQRHLSRLRPPLSPPGFLLLGFDGSALAAAIELLVTPIDRYCFIPAIAVSHPKSRRGLAGEALDHVGTVMAKYEIRDDYVAQARLDPNNDAAKSVFSGRGYEFLETRQGYETWGRLY
ncbi:hypothetical protein PQI51_09690 [Microbacterium esteraromaticum]|uniref:hypothetical protein n=1 Tax=Microbacterium esteraromaticum TaxID=57043 RepID=UPI0030AFE9A3